jgi:GNAT superfamily N-acetyltransferase
MEYTIKQATIIDVPQIKEISDIMLKETKLGIATVKKIRNLVTGGNTVVYIATADDKCVGFICGIMYENIFNDVIRVSDIGVFVLPEYRRTSIATDFINKLEQWAKMKKANQLWVGQTTGTNIEGTKLFYEKLGFELTGVNAMKEI